MNRMALGLTFMLLLIVRPGWNGPDPEPLNQVPSSPTAGVISGPVQVGDWTVHVLEVERLDSFYAERLGRVEHPEGVYVIVSLALTYDGASTNDGDRLVPTIWFEITSSWGVVYKQADAFAALAVEDSYRDDTPYPRPPSTGVAEPGVTYFKRYIFDVPADATGLALTSHSSAPEAFSIPLPDTGADAGPKAWDLVVTASSLRETLDPPLTNTSYVPVGVYLVVDVELTKLLEGQALIHADWFALQTPDGAIIDVALRESLELGLPSITEDLRTWEFALVFDVPPDFVNGTLISTGAAPLRVEIPLSPTVVPPATPTVTPTAVPTVAPTETPVPSPTQPPQPGAIRVISATDGPAVPPNASGAVEIIMDTSGSMLQPMGDQSRIDVAKDVLTGVVTEQLPPGSQTILRVFGTEPGSCETSLAIPLSPLDPAAASATIGSLQAVNEVRTPLAASLEAAGNDLAGVDGPKLIVLVTDGEETCGGDPGGVISSLAAQGIDVRINIVGFAIDDPGLEQTLAAWAEQGGGLYFPAENAEDLGPALFQALQPTFDVRDSDGFQVGSGTVNGDAVEVPAGRYTVTVNTEPPTIIEPVVVEPGATNEVVLEDGG